MKVGDKEINGTRSIPHLLHIRMGCDADDTSTREGGELVVVELLGDGPGNHVACMKGEREGPVVERGDGVCVREMKG